MKLFSYSNEVTLKSDQLTPFSKAACRGLLDLPRELRDHIYGFDLVAQEPISVLNFAELPHEKLPRQRHGLSPTLLAVNRQLRDEGAAIFYGLNTFQAKIQLRLHQALRRREVEQAFQTMVLPPQIDPPEPEIICSRERPRYAHPAIRYVKRFEVRVAQVIPNRPHWLEGHINVHHAMQDLCEAFVDPGRLDLFIFTTDGCAPSQQWLTAAGELESLAGKLDVLMWQYHEWHFERALLSASRHGDMYCWLNGAQCDRISLDGPSVFHQRMRSASQWTVATPLFSRMPPLHLSRTGEIGRRLCREAQAFS